MRTKVIMTICLFLLMAGKASAQWSVIDPTNIAQSIINSSNNIVHTSSTAQNMINNFKETVKIYEQGKKYYDALKSVNNLVKDARCQGKPRDIHFLTGVILVSDHNERFTGCRHRECFCSSFVAEGKLSALNMEDFSNIIIVITTCRHHETET